MLFIVFLSSLLFIRALGWSSVTTKTNASKKGRQYDVTNYNRFDLILKSEDTVLSRKVNDAYYFLKHYNRKFVLLDLLLVTTLW